MKRKAPKGKGKGGAKAKAGGGDSSARGADAEHTFDTGYLAFEYHAAIVAATAMLYPAMNAARKAKTADGLDHERVRVCAQSRH